ncbi:isopeptide-forming domain-containing fimbrial protein [Curtobacterium sp. MCPF17_002]|uniref:DUF7507 domain-containing protein n=1 Tax=Curtobacterium sp. MCPF17_002 TaxID=2175645 RepID=UPI0015E8DCB7|nr:isopeptide-forming domain-containing fimbrial protein [Curtobacterium sp. MCPF17_002]WIB76995.1 isopeptide-forming domain-containing fimbrial protein [Curtobacterium sp. MCPF17_002]
MTLSLRARTLHQRIAVIITAIVALVAVVLVGASPAQAAGPATLSLEITAVDPTTGQAVTSTAYGQNNNRLAYRIGYSCSVAECTDAVVTLPAFDLDPTYNQYRLYDYETWTPPAGGGATITNSATTGVTVRLGNVAAGTSATFVVQYLRGTDTSAPNAVAAAYFPPGYQIERSATIASPNATQDVTSSAAPVTWNIAVPSPSIVKTGPATTAPDTDMTYTIAMSSGCFENLGSSRWVATGRTLCAESYEVVDRLPEQAVFVSASDGGTYDAATHTINWAESGPGAAGGWGAATFANWTQRYGYNVRTVTVRYPASAFPESAGGADFSASVTNNVDVSATYLDDAATTRTATTSFRNDVVRTAPFGRADQAKASTADQTVGSQRYVNVPPDTTGLVCPSSGRDDWNRVCTAGQPVAPFSTRTEHYWQVDTYNRGNVSGVATVVDNELGNSDVRVRRIVTNATAPAQTIAWTITDGTTTTTGTTAGANYTAPAGSWLTAATVTSGSLAGPNLTPSGTAGTLFRVGFGYDVPVGSPLFTWRNSASATMTYPGQPQIVPIPVTSSGSVIFREMPKTAAAAPAFSAGFVGVPVVEGGGQVVPGGKVTFGVRGATANIPSGGDVSPQYVFIAPAGWNVTRNSASFPAGSVPAGVSYVYKTVTIAGATREAVIASWPTGTTFGANATWPTMSVSASPTATVAAGTNSVATTWAGDSRNVYDANTTTWGGKVVDTTDIDGDGNTAEAFASATTSVTVSGTQRLDVVKEICVRTADGCDWVSNPDIVVGVDPDATDISYRITLQNGGNTVLSDVVGYDVLPYVNDARGSTFGETFNSVTSQSANVALTYSGSQNPCRAEVVATNPGCTDDWSGTASGAQAVRAAVTGTLAPGATAQFVFTTNVVPGAPADAVACNSVAIDSASTLPSEPRAVCATTQEADLAVTVPDRLPLQAGRPGVVPFTVTNLGGSEAAPASVEIAVPRGIRISSLTPAGWLCSADDTDPDGSVLGPVTLTCDPVTADGSSRMLALDEPDALNLPAVVPDDALVGDDACFPATVSGLMSDPVTANNTDSACLAVLPGESLVGLTKDDDRDDVTIGDEYTYTIDAANLLVGETLTDLTVTDELPSSLAFVSASNGGTVISQADPAADGNRAGGTVTWNLGSLAPAGQTSGDGDAGAGGANATQRLTVTVRVVQAAEADDHITNEASVSVVDPTQPDVTLTASDADTDDLVLTASLALVKSATPTVDSVGDTVEYSFLVTNTGNVTLRDLTINEGVFTGAGTAPAVTCPASAASVAPGDDVTCTATYDVLQDDLDAGTIVNTATATGDAPAGLATPVSAPSTAAVNVAAAPALQLEKTATPDTAAAAGDNITYSFALTNTGNVTLSDVQVQEDTFDGSGTLGDIVCEPGTASLAPGADVSCEAPYTLTQADVDAGTVTNSARAIGTAPNGEDVVRSAVSAATVTIAPTAALSIVKTANTDTITRAGQTVTYSFAVTNDGNVTMSDIAIDDSDFSGTGDLSAVDCPVGSIAPDDTITCTATYVVTQADVDAGSLSNSATATGTTPAGVVTDPTEPSTVEIEAEQTPGLDVVKSADLTRQADFVAGHEVTYTFVATNTGNVTVNDVSIEDTDFTGTGALSDLACTTDDTSLAPGEQLLCTATYTLTQADIDAGKVTNAALAHGTPVNGDEPLTSTPFDAVIPTPQNASVSVVKTADVDTVSAPDQDVTYSFVITNTGSVTLTDPQVQDTDFSGTGDLTAVTCPADTTLVPGQAVTCTATYSTTQADVDAGSLTNTATAVATTPTGDVTDPSTPSTATIATAAAPGLTVVKTANSDTVTGAGATIKYTFTVTNTGNVTMRNVDITDRDFTGTGTLSAITCASGASTIAPGTTVECAASYVTTAADVAAGTLSNTAVVSGDATTGEAVTSDPSVSTVAMRAAVVPAAGGPGGAADPATRPGELAFTGWTLTGAAAGTGLLLLGGVALILFSRRRRRHQI